MKKVIISLLLCICLVATITACSDTSTSSSENADVEVEESTAEKSEESSTPADPTAEFTVEQKNAYKSGENYLDMMGMSKQGLIDQLSSEYGDKYPLDVAEFAVEQLEKNGVADWDAECEESAQSYLDMMPMSKEELIDQLCSDYGDKYTREQAERAVEKVYQ